MLRSLHRLEERGKVEDLHHGWPENHEVEPSLWPIFRRIVAIPLYIPLLFRGHVFTENGDCFSQPFLLKHLQVFLDCFCEAPQALPMPLRGLDDEPRAGIEQMHNELIRV